MTIDNCIEDKIAAALFQARKYREATVYAENVVSKFPDNIDALVNLSKCYTLIGKFEDSEKLLLRVLSIQANRYDCYLELQIIYGQLGEWEKYEVITQTLVHNIPGDPRFKFNNAWYKIRNGQTFEGLADLEYGRSIGCFGSPHITLDPTKRLSVGTDIKDKRIIVVGEGGLGDEIIAARYFSTIRKLGGVPISICHPSLKSVFSRMCDEVYELKEDVPDYDYFVPGMACPATFKTIPSDAYLSVNPYYKLKHGSLFKTSKLKVGIRWFGNPEFEHEQHRSISKELMYSLDKEGVELYSLQLEDTDLPLDSWEDTLAIISQLDLVVTSCTSVAHVAGALGQKTVVLTPTLAYYPWANPDVKWYPNVTVLHRDGKLGYSPCIAQVNSIIKEMLL